jgi:hypothetical protein
LPFFCSSLPLRHIPVHRYFMVLKNGRAECRIYNAVSLIKGQADQWYQKSAWFESRTVNRSS